MSLKILQFCQITITHRLTKSFIIMVSSTSLLVKHLSHFVARKAVKRNLSGSPPVVSIWTSVSSARPPAPSSGFLVGRRLVFRHPGSRGIRDFTEMSARALGSGIQLGRTSLRNPGAWGLCRSRQTLRIVSFLLRESSVWMTGD